MRAVIICGGELGNKESVLLQIKKDDFIICADSGVAHAVALGLEADVVIGDFDSYDKEKVECKNIIEYPVKKDFTDSEIAADYACKNGADEILFIAATGGRVDHTLGNIYLLKTLLDRGVCGKVFDGTSTMWLCRGETVINGSAGDIVSLIPFTEVGDITTEGLEYALSHGKLPSTGISNVMVLPDAKISIGEGSALIIHTKK